MALPLFVFSEPDPVKKVNSTEYDPIAMGRTIAIPEGYTIYNKVVVQGPMSINEFIAKMKADFNV